MSRAALLLTPEGPDGRAVVWLTEYAAMNNSVVCACLEILLRWIILLPFFVDGYGPKYSELQRRLDLRALHAEDSNAAATRQVGLDLHQGRRRVVRAVLPEEDSEVILLPEARGGLGLAGY